MSTIKKVKMEKSMEPRVESNYEQNEYSNIVAQEIEEFDDDELALRYLSKNPVSNWSDNEPSTIEEMTELINNMKNEGVPIGTQLAIIAKIDSLPYVKMLSGEGRGWAAAGEVQTGPDTEQFNILHKMAVNARKLNGVTDPDYANGSCAQAVATLILTLYDVNFPITNPTVQEQYMQRNPDKYTFVCDIKNEQDWSGVQPGDIIMSETIDGHKHVMLCAGIEDGQAYFYEGAATRDGFSMYPIVTLKSVNDDAFGRSYHIYRPSENGVNDNLYDKLNLS